MKLLYLACLTVLWIALLVCAVHAATPQAPLPPQAPVSYEIVTEVKPHLPPAGNCKCGCVQTGKCDCKDCDHPKGPSPTPPCPNCQCGCTKTGKCDCKDCDHPRLEPKKEKACCSSACTCGCNAGGPCECSTVRTSSTSTPQFAPVRSTFQTDPRSGGCRSGG